MRKRSGRGDEEMAPADDSFEVGLMHKTKHQLVAHLLLFFFLSSLLGFVLFLSFLSFSSLRLSSPLPSLRPRTTTAVLDKFREQGMVRLVDASDTIDAVWEEVKAIFLEAGFKAK